VGCGGEREEKLLGNPKTKVFLLSVNFFCWNKKTNKSAKIKQTPKKWTLKR
jgi:hypothetical protein